MTAWQRLLEYDQYQSHRRRPLQVLSATRIEVTVFGATGRRKGDGVDHLLQYIAAEGVSL